MDTGCGFFRNRFRRSSPGRASSRPVAGLTAKAYETAQPPPRRLSPGPTLGGRPPSRARPSHTKAGAPRTSAARSAARAQGGRHGAAGPGVGRAPSPPGGPRGQGGRGSGKAAAGLRRREEPKRGGRVAVRSGPSPSQDENNTTATWPRRGARREEGRAGARKRARAGARGSGSPGRPGRPASRAGKAGVQPQAPRGPEPCGLKPGRRRAWIIGQTRRCREALYSSEHSGALRRQPAVCSLRGAAAGGNGQGLGGLRLAKAGNGECVGAKRRRRACGEGLRAGHGPNDPAAVNVRLLAGW